MLKKAKLYAGISLIVQSFSFIILFFMLYNKKKSLAKAFLAVAAIGSVSGILLLNSKGKVYVKRKKAAEEKISPDDTFSLDENEDKVIEPEFTLADNDEVADPEFTLSCEDLTVKNGNTESEDEDIVFDFSLDDEDFSDSEDLKAE